MANVTELSLKIIGVDELSGPLSHMHGSLSSFGNTIAEVGKMAAGFALGGALQAMGGSISGAFEKGITSASDFGNQVLTLQRQIGGTAESVSGMLVAMERFGLSGDQASVSLGIFSKHLLGIEDAMDGGQKLGKSFGQTMHDLGVTFTDASGNALPMNDILLKVADRFHDMPDGVDKTALSMQLFGRSGKDMILFLNQGSEGLKEAMEAAQKYGLTLTGDNLEAVRKFGLAHKDMDEAMQGLTLQLGVALMPALAAGAEALAGLAQSFNANAMPAIKAFAEEIGGPVHEALDVLGTALDGLHGLFLAFTVDAGGMGIALAAVRTIFGDTVANAIEPFVQSFMHAIPAIQRFAGQVLADIGNLSNGLTSLLNDAFVGNFMGALADMQSQVIPSFQRILNAVVNVAHGFLENMMGQGGLVGGVAALSDAYITAWQGMWNVFLDVMQGDWGVAYDDLREAFKQVVALETEGLTDIEGVLAQWGQAFIDWVPPATQGMMAALGPLLQELTAWIVSPAGPAIGAALLEWGTAFVEWVGPAAVSLAGELFSILGTVNNFILVDALPLIIGSLIGWSEAFYQWVANDVLPNLPGELAKIITAIVAWATGDGLTTAATQGAAIGQSLVDGIGGAITAGVAALKKNATTAIENMIAAMKAAAGIGSPSKLFYDEVGTPIVDGIIAAFSDGVKPLGDAAAALVNSAIGPALSTTDRLLDDFAATAKRDLAVGPYSASDSTQLLAEAVRTFADRTHTSWEAAAGYMKQFGISAQQVLGHDLPAYAKGSSDGMDGMRGVLLEDKDQVNSYLQSIGVTATNVLGTIVPGGADATGAALTAATAPALGLSAALLAIPKNVTTTITTNYVSGGSPGTPKGYSTTQGHTGEYTLPNIVTGGSITVMGSNLVSAIAAAAGVTGVTPAQQAAGGTFGTNTSPTLFQSGGPVLGPLGAPVAAIVHGGEYVMPAGSWGGGIDYAKLAAALASQPIVIQVDGRTLGHVTRTDTARWSVSNLPYGVGGL